MTQDSLLCFLRCIANGDYSTTIVSVIRLHSLVEFASTTNLTCELQPTANFIARLTPGAQGTIRNLEYGAQLRLTLE